MVPVPPSCGLVIVIGAPSRFFTHSGAQMPPKRRIFNPRLVWCAALRLRTSVIAWSMALSGARLAPDVGWRSFQYTLTTNPASDGMNAVGGGPSRSSNPARTGLRSRGDALAEGDAVV